MQVAVSLAETELKSSEGRTAGEAQAASVSNIREERAKLIRQFRQQKQKVLKEGIARLRQGLQQLH